MQHIDDVLNVLAAGAIFIEKRYMHCSKSRKTKNKQKR